MAHRQTQTGWDEHRCSSRPIIDKQAREDWRALCCLEYVPWVLALGVKQRRSESRAQGLGAASPWTKTIVLDLWTISTRSNFVNAALVLFDAGLDDAHFHPAVHVDRT